MLVFLSPPPRIPSLILGGLLWKFSELVKAERCTCWLCALVCCFLSAYVTFNKTVREVWLPLEVAGLGMQLGLNWKPWVPSLALHKFPPAGRVSVSFFVGGVSWSPSVLNNWNQRLPERAHLGKRKLFHVHNTISSNSQWTQFISLKDTESGAWWCMPVILATWEAEAEAENCLSPED